MTRSKPPLKQGNSNDFQTPPNALDPLIPFLNKDWTIWECACGKGNLVNSFKKRGFDIIGTDIIQGYDFLKYEPKEYDCIITNPPFSVKQQFLERAYKIGKPFALLLPLTTFETPKRQALFKKYGLQVIFFDKRINFETPSGKGSGSWFATAWFTWGLNLPSDFMFVNLNRKEKELSYFKEVENESM